MANGQPPFIVVHTPEQMPVGRTLRAAQMPNRDRLHRLHLDVLEEFSRFGLIAGVRRGWRQDREGVDG